MLLTVSGWEYIKLSRSLFYNIHVCREATGHVVAKSFVQGIFVSVLRGNDKVFSEHLLTLTEIYNNEYVHLKYCRRDHV